jgi:hypothetical protein
MKSLDTIKPYFISGNQISVERATIKSEDFNALVSEVETLEAKLKEYLAYDSIDGRKERQALRKELKELVNYVG